MLGIKLLPYSFIQFQKNVEFKLEFKSNCLRFSVKKFFVLPTSDEFDISFDNHPKRVILNVFGKAYQFDFSEPIQIVKKDSVDIKYLMVRVIPSTFTERIDLEKDNSILLRTSENNTFTKQDID